MEPLAWSVAGAATVVAAGLAVRLRRRASRAARDRASEAIDTAATRALAASDERARIAREMHDVVAHTLTVVVAQADGARFAAKRDPAVATRALETIGEVGRAALTEMRGLLGVLRDTDPQADLGPQPSLPIGAGLAVYRVVQEALTNVLKHAGPKVTAYVQLRWLPDAVEVTVSDDGRGAAAGRGKGGTGIEGMRERATIFGGTLSAGPKRGGGYVVRARLPLTPRNGKAGA
jgi:signal transduction histidine kinase